MLRSRDEIIYRRVFDTSPREVYELSYIVDGNYYTIMISKDNLNSQIIPLERLEMFLTQGLPGTQQLNKRVKVANSLEMSANHEILRVTLDVSIDIHALKIHNETFVFELKKQDRSKFNKIVLDMNQRLSQKFQRLEAESKIKTFSQNSTNLYITFDPYLKFEDYKILKKDFGSNPPFSYFTSGDLKRQEEYKNKMFFCNMLLYEPDGGYIQKETLQWVNTKLGIPIGSDINATKSEFFNKWVEWVNKNDDQNLVTEFFEDYTEKFMAYAADFANLGNILSFLSTIFFINKIIISSSQVIINVDTSLRGSENRYHLVNNYQLGKYLKRITPYNIDIITDLYYQSTSTSFNTNYFLIKVDK